MPTIRFIDRTLAALKPTPGQQIAYFDRTLPGFGLRISGAGRKVFIVSYRPLGRRTMRRQSLGVYPLMTLATARERAEGVLKKADAGRDPAAEEQVARARTFGALADLYLEKHAKRHKKSWRDDARMIRRELQAWRDLPVAALRRQHVIDRLDAIVDRGAPVLANRVHSLITKILNYGLGLDGWLDANVAAKLPKSTRERARARVLSSDELRMLWTYLSRPAPKKRPAAERRAWTLGRAWLKLRLITAQRGGEVLDLKWSEIADGWWTQPDSKNRTPHRVWLSASAWTVLNALPGPRTGYVFAGIRGARHRRGLLDGLGLDDMRPHDFRRTATTILSAGKVPRLIVSRILNHKDRSITGSVYDLYEFDQEKRDALNWWAAKLAAIVSGKAANVLPFAKGA